MLNQNSADHFVVLFLCPGKDQNIIQIYYHDTFCYEVLKNVIHHSLEGDWAIGHTKEHYQKFEKTMVYIDGSIPLFTGLDTDIVEALVYVQLSKYHRPWSFVTSLEIKKSRYLFLIMSILRFLQSCTRQRSSSFFLIKNTSIVIRNFKSCICLVLRFFVINKSNSDYFVGNREYIFDNLGSIPEISSIA